jgi:hypothetical protein
MKAILRKVAASGRAYFHTGRVHQIGTDGGGTVIVAETSLFEGDAHRFLGADEAQAEADWINARGISDAKWAVAEVAA